MVTILWSLIIFIAITILVAFILKDRSNNAESRKPQISDDKESANRIKLIQSYKIDSENYSDIRHDKDDKEYLHFEKIPNGKYLVKYIDEKAYQDEFILIIFEITKGRYKGKRIPLKFDGGKAKRVISEATGDFVSRLAFEGVKIADKLENILFYLPSEQYAQKNIEFLIRIDDGFVATVYSFNEDEITRFIKRVTENPDFKGEKRTRPKNKIIPNRYKEAHFTLNIIRELENKTETVKGSNDIYEINLFQMTCTCPDFKKRRKNFEKNDVRRPCKHILTKLRRKKMMVEHDELTQCILDARPSGEKMAMNYMASGEPVVFCYGEGVWIDVFSRKRKKGDIDGKYTGGYDRFGFNVEENRWSYGAGPPGAIEIREMIKALT